MPDGHQAIGVDRAFRPIGSADWVVHGDFLDSATMTRAFDAAPADGECEPFLINNAGVSSPEFPRSDAAWELALSVNLNAAFQWSRRFTEAVTSGVVHSGGIVLIGSLATTMGFPRDSASRPLSLGLLGSLGLLFMTLAVTGFVQIVDRMAISAQK